jgi:predicted PurR-regulated permease PerM
MNWSEDAEERGKQTTTSKHTKKERRKQMDACTSLVTGIFQVVLVIQRQCALVVTNKSKCEMLAKRIEILTEPLAKVKEKSLLSKKGLENLLAILNEIQVLIEEFTQKKWFKRLFTVLSLISLIFLLFFIFFFFVIFSSSQARRKDGTDYYRLDGDLGRLRQ